MIISPGRNYVFVHIPKTGGTSLALALEQKAMKDDILIGDTPKAKNRKNRLKGVKTSGRLWKHSSIRDIGGLVEPDWLAQAFVFTIVRNPWDRMVSYFHWLQIQTFDHPAVDLAKSLPFSDFLNQPLNRASFRRDGSAEYTCDESGRDLCGLHLRLERLQEDVPALEARIGVKLPDIPHSNRSERAEGYRNQYSDADAALIANAYQDDIKRFGYRF